MLVIGATGAAVLLSACQESGSDSVGQVVDPTGGPGGTTSEGRTEPAVPALPTLEPVAGSRERVVTWTLHSDRIDPTSTSVVVEVEVGGPPCDVVTGYDTATDPTGDDVSITVWAGLAEGTTCAGQPALLGRHALVIVLDDPIGERELVPGSS